MKLATKWFVAGGALFLIISFFLPVISISNLGKQAFLSLSQIAGAGYWFFLFPVPVFALVILLLALAPVGEKKINTIFFIGQAVGLAVILILLLGTLSYMLVRRGTLWDNSNLGGLLPSEILHGNLTIWPGIGFFTLVLGMGVIAFGIITSFPIKPGKIQEEQVAEVVEPVDLPPFDEAKPLLKEAYLIRKSGQLAGKKISIQVEDFSIGRRNDNDLQLREKIDGSISRIHARIRYSQGAWYIQDQNSKIGTFINGKRVKATRLKTNDIIKIGDEVFVFQSD